MASGSIAQQHPASLRFQYRKPMVVAVKVRHRKVAEPIRSYFVIYHLRSQGFQS